MAPIALFDSGLGGLTVLNALKKALPQANYAYLGDTARTPYGTKGPETVRRYSAECTGFLNSLSPKIIVVACNTASALALDIVRQKADCPAYGTIEAAAQEAASITKSGNIAILATRATIQSRVFEDHLKGINSSLQTVSIQCPLFVPLVEEGITSGPILDAVLDQYLSPLLTAKVDTIILGCTHYPLLTNSIQRYLGDRITLVECSTALANRIKLDLQTPLSGDGSTSYFATDDIERFCRVAPQFIGEPIGEAQLISIERLTNNL